MSRTRAAAASRSTSEVVIDFRQDHFALFDLPRTFRVDAAALDRRYRALQSEVHPDRHASAEQAADPALQRMALQASARVNEAYATLRDPASRGEYLLSLEGIESLSETDTVMPPDFLMEQMERREAIEDAARDGNSNALEAALQDIAVERLSLIDDIANALDRRQLDNAKTAVRKLRFLDRVKSEINDALIAIEA